MTVEFTDAALGVVRQVRAARPEASFVFVFGEGCCEGTAPHLFADHHVPASAREVGRADDVPVLVDERLRSLYAGRQVTIDVDEDPLADGFSAEVALGYRFTLRSELACNAPGR